MNKTSLTNEPPLLQKHSVSGITCFPSKYDKHYDLMSRREKRDYKRWLEKNNMWDGAIVIENLQREKRLNVGSWHL